MVQYIVVLLVVWSAQQHGVNIIGTTCAIKPAIYHTCKILLSTEFIGCIVSAGSQITSMICLYDPLESHNSRPTAILRGNDSVDGTGRYVFWYYPRDNGKQIKHEKVVNDEV